MKNEKIYIPGYYPDLLDKIKLTSANIYEIIEPYRLFFSQTRNRSVEWEIKFPMFVNAFYDYIIKYSTIPAQQPFFDYYLSFNKAFFDEKNFDAAILDGLKARVFRTYPSLVRDVYFNKYVKENLLDINVIYNITLDISEGIDLMIEAGTIFYAVNLYTRTSRACDARNIKQNRHQPFVNVNYIDLPVDLNNNLRCGDFFLYGCSEFASIKKHITINLFRV